MTFTGIVSLAAMIELHESNGIRHAQFVYESRKALDGNLGTGPRSRLCSHERFASGLSGPQPSPLFYRYFVGRSLEIDRRLLYDYLTYCRYDKVGRTECPHDVANYPGNEKANTLRPVPCRICRSAAIQHAWTRCSSGLAERRTCEREP